MVMAVGEEGRGNGVDDPYLGFYGYLINQQCFPFFCLAFLSLIICARQILKVGFTFLLHQLNTQHAKCRPTVWTRQLPSVYGEAALLFPSIYQGITPVSKISSACMLMLSWLQQRCW